MRLFFALPLSLAACAPAAPVVAPAPAVSSIAMDRSSWGRPVSRWTIDAAGKGSYTVPEPDVFNAERLVTRGFATGPEGFAEIRKLLAIGEARAGRELVCGARITDQYYGTVRWGDVHLVYDMGCQDKATEEVLKGITAAERKVAAWAANQPILETQKVERQ
ncbi:hypothetical protein HNP52_001095 [Sphingomonas kyeonggiensis]|uniref:Lipoprotein n=1 Tax=Sphingomonas kyeonggiensis TaxID=1268553 RepID=A0A7W7JZB2_9SPHN|nr:hypothetical protein [Sphingomonas kyeonggiensis]MBB4838044.1 hypothetical protein [Sphingomonas kyeonggiensis]